MRPALLEERSPTPKQLYRIGHGGYIHDHVDITREHSCGGVLAVAGVLFPMGFLVSYLGLHGDGGGHSEYIAGRRLPR